MKYFARDSASHMQLPTELVLLIEQNIWPTSATVASNESIKKVLDRNEFSKLIPDESGVHFYSPPFLTVFDEIELGGYFWKMPETVVDQIDPEKTVVLGDFGHGSDTALALDYRHSQTEPSVIRLQWASSNPKQNNRWVLVSPSFGEFCKRLKLI